MSGVCTIFKRRRRAVCTTWNYKYITMAFAVLMTPLDNHPCRHGKDPRAAAPPSRIADSASRKASAVSWTRPHDRRFRQARSTSPSRVSVHVHEQRGWFFLVYTTYILVNVLLPHVREQSLFTRAPRTALPAATGADSRYIHSMGNSLLTYLK